MNVRHNLNTVLLRQLQKIIEYLKAVHTVKLCVVGIVVVCLGIFSRRPRIYKLSRHRHTDKVESVIGNSLYGRLKLTVP